MLVLFDNVLDIKMHICARTVSEFSFDTSLALLINLRFAESFGSKCSQSETVKVRLVYFPEYLCLPQSTVVLAQTQVACT